MDIKIGSFRVMEKNGSCSYMSYSEFYARSEEYREKIRKRAQDGEIHLYCACNPENKLPLIITKNHVVRVSQNKGQQHHLESCPKSEVYESWASEHQKGLMEIGEDGKPCFYITIPSGIPSKGGSSSSESDGDSDGRKRTGLKELITNVSYYAWQKQTYSIKKNIKECHAEGKKPDWTYKGLDDFTRLYFGVAGDIKVYWHQEYRTLKSLCYRADAFFQSDYKEKYLVYAKIEKLGEWKEDRKYQYITLRMRSHNSPNKAVVRIQTEKIKEEDYATLKESIKDENKYYMLAGYARHDVFADKEKKEDQHWITMLNHVVIPVSRNGLVLRSEQEQELLDEMCRRRILFKKALMPLANYGGYSPTAIIEQQHGKDIIIDIADTPNDYKKKEKLAENNPEFDVMLYKKKTDPDTIINELFCKFRKKD